MGGSIAWLDAAQELHIGPKSAGSYPGPVCYSKGGTEVTITDANLVLGYINPEGLVGGGLPLDQEKAKEALTKQIAEPLGLELVTAAYGIHLLGNSTMIRAVRAVSTERGRDLRDSVLIAFGGSGPVHACQMGRSLEMKQAIIPPHSGLFSAFGLLSADIEHHRIQTCYQNSRKANFTELNHLMKRMETEVTALLLKEGFSLKEITMYRAIDLRYSGQSYELTLPISKDPISADTIHKLENAFDKEHEKTYGHRASLDESYTLVNLRLVGKVTQQTISLSSSSFNKISSKKSCSREAYFGPKYGWIETPLLTRSDLLGNLKQGPFLIDEFDTTVVIQPDCQVTVDDSENIIIDFLQNRPEWGGVIACFISSERPIWQA